MGQTDKASRRGDIRPSYEPPRALRMGAVGGSTGACQGPGTGDGGLCDSAGIGATGAGCNWPGNGADGSCKSLGIDVVY